MNKKQILRMLGMAALSVAEAVAIEIARKTVIPWAEERINKMLCGKNEGGIVNERKVS